MSFIITGLDPKPFEHLVGADAATLAAHGAERMLVDGPGFPDRITLEELAAGETVLLLNYEHQPEPTPYRSAHAIFVADRSAQRGVYRDRIPRPMRARTLSLRAFDARGSMVDAELVEGAAVEAVIERMFARDDVAYIHAHYAVRGCYAARIDRATTLRGA